MSPINAARKASCESAAQNNPTKPPPHESSPRIAIVPAITPGPAVAPETRRAVFGSAPEFLADIYAENIHLAAWQRQLSPTLIEECQAYLDQKGFNSHRLVVPTAKAGNLCALLPGLAGYPHLRADIELLADMFSCLFDPGGIGLRLTALADSMCPRFHIDRVPCRLITTYLGPGTEWLPHHSLDRSKLGAGSGGLSDAESGLYPPAQPVQALAPGDVALLKGELWEGNAGAGLVHRSPAIEPGQRRLILTFDFASTDD